MRPSVREGSQQTSLVSSGLCRLHLPFAAAPDYIMGPKCLTSKRPSLAAGLRSPYSPVPATRHVPIPVPGLLGEWVVPPTSPLHCEGALGSLGGGGEALSREMNSWPSPRCRPAQLCSGVTLGAHTAPLYAWALCPPWAWHQLHQQQWLRQLLSTPCQGPSHWAPGRRRREGWRLGCE